MENKFKFEIISPENIIFSDDVNMVTIPSYEGDMSILKNHISIITFLKPGKIKIQKEEGNFDEFFIQDGTVENFNNSLVVLSSSVHNIKNLSQEFINNLNKETIEKLSNENITDHDRYVLNHQLDTLKEIVI